MHLKLTNFVNKIKANYGSNNNILLIVATLWWYSCYSCLLWLHFFVLWIVLSSLLSLLCSAFIYPPGEHLCSVFPNLYCAVVITDFHSIVYLIMLVITVTTTYTCRITMFVMSPQPTRIGSPCLSCHHNLCRTNAIPQDHHACHDMSPQPM